MGANRTHGEWLTRISYLQSCYVVISYHTTSSFTKATRKDSEKATREKERERRTTCVSANLVRTFLRFVSRIGWPAKSINVIQGRRRLFGTRSLSFLTFSHLLHSASLLQNNLRPASTDWSSLAFFVLVLIAGALFRVFSPRSRASLRSSARRR